MWWLVGSDDNDNFMLGWSMKYEAGTVPGKSFDTLHIGWQMYMRHHPSSIKLHWIPLNKNAPVSSRLKAGFQL